MSPVTNLHKSGAWPTVLYDYQVPKGSIPMKLTDSHILAVYFTASLAEREEGLNWYARASRIADELAAEYELTTEITAAVIALLSPNNKWHRNVIDAEALIKAWATGQNCDQVKVCTYGPNKEKAIRVLEGEPVDEVISGRKVTAFFHCIVGCPNSVCIDGHAYNIWRGEQSPLDEVPSISKKNYELICNDYISATKKINLIDDRQHLLASEVQAITWVTWRNRINGADN